MSDGIEIINPLSCPGWDDLVIASGKGTFFHSSNWARACMSLTDTNRSTLLFLMTKGIRRWCHSWK